jgi:hypothetical protein
VLIILGLPIGGTVALAIFFVLFSRYINCIILPTTSLVDEMPICYFKIDVVLW